MYLQLLTIQEDYLTSKVVKTGRNKYHHDKRDFEPDYNYTSKEENDLNEIVIYIYVYRWKNELGLIQ